MEPSRISTALSRRANPLTEFRTPKGFIFIGTKAGLKSSGDLDLALVINRGDQRFGTAVFTSNRVEAAPVTWSREVIKDHQVEAVLLNSGGANACTGSQGFLTVHKSAEYVAQALSISASDVLVCSTGMIGVQLPLEKIISGVENAVSLSQDPIANSISHAARAIMTTDSVPKISLSESEGVLTVGIAKGAGMLAPGLATMLAVVATDSIVDSKEAEELFREVVKKTFDRIDSDGCMSTNDTVVLLASGASGVKLSGADLERAIYEVCTDLAIQLISDAEGNTKVIEFKVKGAVTEADAVAVGKACARNNLLKCAINGEDPNWGRILAAVGTTNAVFDPYKINVSINDVEICRDSAPGADRALVDMSDRFVSILIDLRTGDKEVGIWSNDLSAEYVHENSEYST